MENITRTTFHLSSHPTFPSSHLLDSFSRLVSSITASHLPDFSLSLSISSSSHLPISTSFHFFFMPSSHVHIVVSHLPVFPSSFLSFPPYRCLSFPSSHLPCFLDASSHLYMRVCLSVGPSVRWSVRRSVRW